jgi:hypothetical protein
MARRVQLKLKELNALHTLLECGSLIDPTGHSCIGIRVKTGLVIDFTIDICHGQSSCCFRPTKHSIGLNLTFTITSASALKNQY